jgi:hypothetical protein
MLLPFAARGESACEGGRASTDREGFRAIA